MTPLILGRSGQVASHLREQMPDALFWGRDTLDLQDTASIEARIREAAPSCVVNAAAYTAVDKAESEPEAAWAVNASAVAAMSLAAKSLDVPLIHISTDYVFNGQKAEPYRVDDTTGPISAYGRTKLGGELAVATLAPKHWILRTSWVFSEHGANFVKTMLRLAEDRSELNIVADQHGVPSYAGDIAAVIGGLVDRGAELGVPWGTHHAVGGPATTWCEFAKAIFASAHRRGLLGQAVKVDPIATADYPTPARRPANSMLEASHEMLGTLGVTMDWQAGLERMLERITLNGNQGA